MSDSINWNIWLPVICAVSGMAAICSVGIVVYCYCRIRDTLTPVSYVEEHNFTREPEPIRNGPPVNRVQFPAVSDDSNTNELESVPPHGRRVKFQSDGSYEDEASTLTLNRNVAPRYTRGDISLRLPGAGTTDSIGRFTGEPDHSSLYHDNHIVEQDDGTQDVFV